MKSLITPLAVLALAVVTLSAPALAQESDYEVKTGFEARYKAIKMQIDSSFSTGGMDSLKQSIDSLEEAYSPRREFLDKALYPETFGEQIANLRALHLRTYDRVSLIQNQGVRIGELESQIAILTRKLDSLGVQRDQLFAELQEAKKAGAAMRETIKRLTANLQAKDRLIFALIDTIFLPYDKNVGQMTDFQKDAISRKLLKANVMARVYDIAADNVKFLEMTQLQPKDYAGLLDQYQQFSTKWNGLRDKINAVNESNAGRPAKEGKGKSAVTPSAEAAPVAYVDSILNNWNARLATSYWAGLRQEFTSKGVVIGEFTDARSFAARVRAYVDSMKTSGQDASIFINDIWKNRIDKEWRESLTKENMLGKTEYASLDKSISELGAAKFDTKFVFYIALVAVLAVLAWWIFGRKSKTGPPRAS